MLRSVMWMLLCVIFLIWTAVLAEEHSGEAAKAAGQQNVMSISSQFNVFVTLTDAAAALLAKKEESIIVFGSFSGQPKPGTSEKQIDTKTGLVPLLIFEKEKKSAGLVVFSNLLISDEKITLIKEASPFFYMNVVSGRKSAESNLLDCSTYQGSFRDIQGRTIEITCRLIGEQTERPIYGSIKQENEIFPEMVVRQLYTNFSSIWCKEKELSKYISKELAQKIEEACERNLIGSAIECPIIPGNDFDEKEIIQTLQVACTKQENTSCTAIFENFGKKYSVTFLLQLHKSGYFVFDIVGDQDFSFRNKIFKALK